MTSSLTCPARSAPVDSARVDYDCVVIGGGVAGLMTALRLATAGRRVAVLERDRFGAGATMSNHGIIHSGALFAELHPEIVSSCYAAQAAYARSFPTALVPTLPAWYLATPDRMATRQRCWDELGIPHRGVEPGEARDLLAMPAATVARAAQVAELVISTRALIADLLVRCVHAGVTLWSGTPAHRVVVANRAMLRVLVGARDQLTARDVVLCAGIGTKDLLTRSGSALGGRLRSRLDMMLALPNLALPRPILGLEYGWPTLAPAAGGTALASRYGAAQPPVDGPGRWPVPVDEAAQLVAELARVLRPGLVEFTGSQARVCSKTEYAAGSADAWGVEPNYAVIEHQRAEDISGLWTLLPGKMTLALHASRELATRLTGRSHELALEPPPVPPARLSPEHLADNPWNLLPSQTSADTAAGPEVGAGEVR